MPLRDGCCDSAWLSTVLHHLSDPAGCAGELRRVVRPGGWVLIRQAFPDRPEPGTRLFTYWPGARAILARAPTLQATRATFAAAGFTFHRLEQISDQSSASLKEAHARARVRADSLLRLLPDAEFKRGLEALERAAAAETTPTPVIRRLWRPVGAWPRRRSSATAHPAQVGDVEEEPREPAPRRGLARRWGSVRPEVAGHGARL